MLNAAAGTASRVLAVMAALGLGLATARAELREAFVDPTDTDPAIRPLDELPGAAGRRLDHFIAHDEVAHNGFLYVHLVGSGGLPENNLVFARHVARRGFHVASIAYPNWPSVVELTFQSNNGAAPGAVREERLFGVDATALVDVDAANSIVGRLTRLLDFLDRNHPDEGWNRFLVGDRPAWSRIVVGGHSQGAGHAAYLGQRVRLAGALLLGGPGDFVAGVGIADWPFDASVTPPGRLFGFVHELDPNFNGFQVVQAVLGLDAFGPIHDVDSIPPSTWISHRLTSSRIDIPGANFHGAVVVDEHLPLDPSGEPAYASAWDYMLGSVVFTDSFGD